MVLPAFTNFIWRRGKNGAGFESESIVGEFVKRISESGGTLTIVSQDGSNVEQTINFTPTGGGGGGPSQEQVGDWVNALIRNGSTEALDIQYDDTGNRLIFRVTDKLAQMINDFGGGGWRTLGVDDPVIQFSAWRNTAYTVVEVTDPGFAFYNTRTQGPIARPGYIVVRVPIAAAESLSLFALQNEASESGNDELPLDGSKTTDVSMGTVSIMELHRVPAYVYLQVQTSQIPAGTFFRVVARVPFTFEGLGIPAGAIQGLAEYIADNLPQSVVSAETVTTGPKTGLTVTSSNTDVFDPSPLVVGDFDFDTSGNANGDFFLDATLTLGNVTGTGGGSIGFDEEPASPLRVWPINERVYVPHITAAQVFASNMLHGVQVGDEIPVYQGIPGTGNGRVQIGAFTLWASRNAANAAVFFAHYDGQGGSFGYTLTLTGFHVGFLPEAGGAAPSAGGTAPAAEVLLDWTSQSAGTWRGRSGFLTREAPAAVALSRALTSADDGRILEIEIGGWAGTFPAPTDQVISAISITADRWRNAPNVAESTAGHSANGGIALTYVVGGYDPAGTPNTLVPTLVLCKGPNGRPSVACTGGASTERDISRLKFTLV